MRNWLLCLMLGVTVIVLVGCAVVPSAYHLAPDGAKEFVLTMRAGSFSPTYLVVNQGDRVRLVIYSYYQFAFFTFNEFHITLMVPHDTPEVVAFVAIERGWFDFKGYGFYSSYAHLMVADLGGASTAGPEHVLYGRLYVM